MIVRSLNQRPRRYIFPLSPLLAFILTFSVTLLSPSLCSCSFFYSDDRPENPVCALVCCCYIHLAEQGKGKSHSGTSKWVSWSVQAEPAWGWPLGHRSGGCGRPWCPGNTAETLHSQWTGGSPWFLLGVPGDTQVCPRMLFRGRLIRGWGALKCPNACIYYVSVEQKVLKYMYSYNNRHCKHDVLFNWKWRGWTGSTGWGEAGDALRSWCQQLLGSCALACHWHMLWVTISFGVQSSGAQQGCSEVKQHSVRLSPP